MSNSPLSEEIQDFRQELQAEKLARVFKVRGRTRWLERLIPRFSLLTLLLLVMLFGLGAAYVSLKRSSLATLEEKDRELRRQRTLAEADRDFLGNRLNLASSNEVNSLAITQRFTWQPLEYPALVLNLDPAKNYVIHASQTNVTAKDYNRPEQSMVITAIGPREQSRSRVVLRIVGTPESVKDPANLLHGFLGCVVELHRLETSMNFRTQQTSAYLIQINSAQIKKTESVQYFYQLWSRQQFLNKGKPTELFYSVDSKSTLEESSGLLIWIEEIQPEAIATLPNRILFPLKTAN